MILSSEDDSLEALIHSLAECFIHNIGWIIVNRNRLTQMYIRHKESFYSEK